jgi:hypothetical protein
VSNSIRATLISSGEHIAAVCKLGDNYTAEEYLEAVDLARTAARRRELCGRLPWRRRRLGSARRR